MNKQESSESRRGPGDNLTAANVDETRRHLAACYRMFARRGMDDLIFTHLSARVPGTTDRFLLIPFGILFEEVAASNRVGVGVAGALAPGAGGGGHAGGRVGGVAFKALLRKLHRDHPSYRD